MVGAVLLVGGQGTVLCSGHWQFVIYKPHHKLLACGFCSASVRVCSSMEPHISASLPDRTAAPTRFDLSALLRWTVLFF